MRTDKISGPGNLREDTEEPIPFALPVFGREEEEAVLRVLRSGWLTTGPEALAFEKEFAAFLSGPETAGGTPPLTCLAVNSATSGLHLALEALGAGPGDAVIVPSYTFTSTAEVVRYLGAEVVFADTAPGTFHLDPRALESALDRLSRGLPAYPPRTGQGEGFGPRGRPRAVIPVHYGGLPCDMDPILEISRRYGAGVIEDAAHAFPSLIPAKTPAGNSREGGSAGTGNSGEGNFAGTLGAIGVFSFYATKTITTGEGGMAVCRHKALADRMGIMRSHGIDRSVWNRYTDKKASWYYEVAEAGYKYNLPDLLAAIGRVQLRRAGAFLETRRDIARRYDEAFAGGPFLLPPTGPGDARHLYPLRLNPKACPLPRDRFIGELQKAGIGVSVHFIPLHIMPYYQKCYALEKNDFPESYRNFQQVISLPIWPALGDARVERVIAAVKTIAGRGG
jgi:dTDP-4-amino-4,6-dideoxygalactose transaminase